MRAYKDTLPCAGARPSRFVMCSCTRTCTYVLSVRAHTIFVVLYGNLCACISRNGAFTLTSTPACVFQTPAVKNCESSGGHKIDGKPNQTKPNQTWNKNVLTFFPPDWGMLRRSRCIQIFSLYTIGEKNREKQTEGNEHEKSTLNDTNTITNRKIYTVL